MWPVPSPDTQRPGWTLRPHPLPGTFNPRPVWASSQCVKASQAMSVPSSTSQRLYLSLQPPGGCRPFEPANLPWETPLKGETPAVAEQVPCTTRPLPIPAWVSQPVDTEYATRSQRPLHTSPCHGRWKTPWPHLSSSCHRAVVSCRNRVMVLRQVNIHFLPLGAPCSLRRREAHGPVPAHEDEEGTKRQE